MRYRKINGIDKDWSVITQGCWQIAPSEGWGKDACSEIEAEMVIKTALDQGITAFDTAEGYGDGESERRLGKALGEKKDDVIIISKIWPDVELKFEAYLERIEGSLKRLGRDYLDACLLHFPTDEMDDGSGYARFVEIMERLQGLGKTKTIGIANFNETHLGGLGNSLHKFSLNQVPYSILDRRYGGVEAGLCDGAETRFMAYAPTAKGLLAKKMSESDLNYPTRQRNPFFQEPLFGKIQKIYDQLETIAGVEGTTVMGLAIAWVLEQKNVHTAIVGSRKPNQVAQLGPIGDYEMTSAAVEQINKIAEEFEAFSSAVA